MAAAVVDVVGKGGTGVVAGAALLEIPIMVEDVESIERADLEEPVLEASNDAADAAQAQTALAEAFTARPVTAPQVSRTLEKATVLIASNESHEWKGRCVLMGTNANSMLHIDMRSQRGRNLHPPRLIVSRKPSLTLSYSSTENCDKKPTHCARRNRFSNRHTLILGLNDRSEAEA